MIQRFLYCDNACLTYIVGKAVVEQVKNICLQNSKLNKSYSISSRKKKFFSSQWVPRSVYINVWYFMKSLFFFLILNGHLDQCPGTIKINLGSWYSWKSHFYKLFTRHKFFKVFRICSMCLITQSQVRKVLFGKSCFLILFRVFHLEYVEMVRESLEIRLSFALSFETYAVRQEIRLCKTIYGFYSQT